MTHSLGVQSRKIWQITTASLPAELEPGKTVENPHMKCRFGVFRFAAASAACTTPALKMFILRRSRGSTAAALQVFPFVTAMNSTSAFVSVCVCAIESRILQQAVGTTVPGTLVVLYQVINTVATHKRALQVIPFFVLSAAALYLWNRAPSYI